MLRLCLFLLLLAPLAACKQGAGDRCQLDSDCDTANGFTCVIPSGGNKQIGGTCLGPSTSTDMASNDDFATNPDLTTAPPDQATVTDGSLSDAGSGDLGLDQ